MNIIIPMAGMGKRLRPHTLTVPKPLIPVAGKPIVQRLVEDIVKVTDEPVDEIAFIVGRFGAEVEASLITIAEKVGAKGRIFYQDEPLGTAHAILCAEPCLRKKVMVAFADTLFAASFTLNSNEDGIIWVHRVNNPESFGVVTLNDNGEITAMIEKPKTFVSDLAIIGIYYFKDGENLKEELQFLIDNDVMEKGEYQLTNALENMRNKGIRFKIGAVDEWLDCGNKDATVYTNQRVLELKKSTERLICPTLSSENSVIVEPCYIGKNVEIRSSVIGPHVSIGDGTRILNAVISNSIIQQQCIIEKAVIKNSMLGNHVQYKQAAKDLSIGDYSTENE
ncbi:MAG: nucleotidyltransferase [Flavobacteriales bacterium]|nr:nucleotidyltransferase [Flavobacteriales bacterium]